MIIASLCTILLAAACNTPKTVTITVSGAGYIIVANSGFQPSVMMAKVGTTITFTNSMAGQMTLVGKSGFTGYFGGMMMQMNGTYQYTFTNPGVYVVSVSGQNIQCTITVVS